jgi:hypothetical protein
MQKAECRRQNAEGRMQKAECRRQNAEGPLRGRRRLPLPRRGNGKPLGEEDSECPSPAQF